MAAPSRRKSITFPKPPPRGAQPPDVLGTADPGADIHAAETAIAQAIKLLTTAAAALNPGGGHN
jgi:hypothetical protein